MNNDALREYCLSLKGATEGIKWEDHLAFMVGTKIFCLTGFEPESPTAIKVSEEDFERLTEKEGVIQAPHWAKRKWISVRQRNALTREEWQAALAASYALVKATLTKKMQAELG